MKKVVIEYHRLTEDAGAYDLVVYDNEITETVRLHINGGSPYVSSYREAELLAVSLDCHFESDDGYKRKPIKEV